MRYTFPLLAVVVLLSSVPSRQLAADEVQDALAEKHDERLTVHLAVRDHHG